MSKISKCLPLSRNMNDSSQVLVSVYVQPRSMPRPGLSRARRRNLLTTSIWTVLFVLFGFFCIYGFLLRSVDRPSVNVNSGEDFSHDISPNKVRARRKFQGKFSGMKNGSSSMFSSQQHSKIWDPKDFDDPSSEKPYCKQRSLFVIIIASSPDHFEHRKQIRSTWCNPEISAVDENSFQCVFLIGQTEDPSVSSKLNQESQSHRDILRGSYLDSYRNLTYKIMHGLDWLSSECVAPYVLKTDDDCFVNTILIKQFLLFDNMQTSNLYAGNMVVKTEKRKVIRKVNVKWSVSHDDYLPEYYPVYASGSGYVLSSDVVTKLVEESKYIKPIPNEDAYTGIVMDSLGVQPTISRRFILSSSGLRQCNYKYIFVAHDVVPTLQRELCDQMITAQKVCRSEETDKGW